MDLWKKVRFCLPALPLSALTICWPKRTAETGLNRDLSVYIEKMKI
jgi:hypothetical protein